MNMSLKSSGFPNCHGAAQHCLPHLTPDSSRQLIESLSLIIIETLRPEVGQKRKMRVRSASCSAVVALKVIAAKII